MIYEIVNILVFFIEGFFFHKVLDWDGMLASLPILFWELKAKFFSRIALFLLHLTSIFFKIVQDLDMDLCGYRCFMLI